MEENKNIDLEEMEKKSEQTLNEIAEKAQEDLKDAKFIKFAIPQEDVTIVNNVKSQLEKTFSGMKEHAEETMNKIDLDISKMEVLKKFFIHSIDANAVSNTELSNVLKEQLAPIDKQISDMQNYKAKYSDKLAIVDKVLNEYLQFKTNDNGEAYIDQVAIDFCKLMLA